MNPIVLLAALSGALAVAAGAFGAHGASGAAVDWLKTGAQYQLLHAIAALAILRLDAKGPAALFLDRRRALCRLALSDGARPAALAWCGHPGRRCRCSSPGWLWLAWLGARRA